jgi:hypothetical protein
VWNHSSNSHSMVCTIGCELHNSLPQSLSSLVPGGVGIWQFQKLSGCLPGDTGLGGCVSLCSLAARYKSWFPDTSFLSRLLWALHLTPQISKGLLRHLSSSYPSDQQGAP